ncbi:MAG TPA: hypothetical protein VG965_06355 [Patescibacteria group bacterium]|nr:hypothetical protein [Patescibacteria group bacterium]
MQFQLVKFPVIRPIVQSINSDIDKFGLHGAMSKKVKKSGARFLTYGIDEEVHKILKDEPVLIVANHAHEIDILAILASLPSRPDTSIVISSRFMNLAPNADKHLIPVYIEHHIDKKTEKIKEKFFRRLQPIHVYNEHEEHLKNIQSIALASKKLSRGGLVIIFPNPNKNPFTKWYSGVGHLLKGVKSKRKVYVIKVYISGTSNLDYFRLIPHASRLLKPIKVAFAKPIAINPILVKHPKEIKSFLEKKYNAWLKKLQIDTTSI